jgi:regulator of protease activity HflC (stomatin/prohibitin superfamily)
MKKSSFSSDLLIYILIFWGLFLKNLRDNGVFGDILEIGDFWSIYTPFSSLISTMNFPLLLIVGLILLVLLFGIRILSPRKVGVVTFLGKISRVIREGFNVIIPFLESVHYQTLEMMNLNVNVDGITKDNVNTSVNINVIYSVKEDDQSVIDSIFKNTNVIEEQLRAKIFEFEHEEIFGKRNEIGDEIRTALEVKLAEFGMELDSVQVIDILLDSQVTQAMNQVVASQKLKAAAITEAEGRKQGEILKAEWDKEVANGFQESIEKIKAIDPSLSGDKILDFLLNSSRIETLEKIGSNNAKVIYINENLEGKKASLIQGE